MLDTPTRGPEACLFLLLPTERKLQRQQKRPPEERIVSIFEGMTQFRPRAYWAVFFARRERIHRNDQMPPATAITVIEPTIIQFVRPGSFAVWAV
jgi:hypothetical protein